MGYENYKWENLHWFFGEIKPGFAMLPTQSRQVIAMMHVVLSVPVLLHYPVAQRLFIIYI
ncbi:MAG: hypothetical protein M3015_12625 [Bacteroidota bacterium]|nr:hypothetical protein [Bacteroidota bacterium]